MKYLILTLMITGCTTAPELPDECHQVPSEGNVDSLVVKCKEIEQE